MNEFDKELLDFYIDVTEKYYELTNKLINIIKNQNSKIKEAIDLINYDSNIKKAKNFIENESKKSEIEK